MLTPFKTDPGLTQAAAVRAELGGNDLCSAYGYTARSTSPVLALARDLVDAGHDPDAPLEAYRDDVLCLRCRSVGEAAGLEVGGNGVGFRKSEVAPTKSYEKRPTTRPTGTCRRPLSRKDTPKATKP